VNADRSKRARHYRPERKRRAHTTTLTVTAALIAVAFLVATGARAVIARNDCTHHPMAVTVAVAPEIGPVVQHLGDYFNKLHRQVGGRCVRVDVAAEPPAAVAAQLAAGRASPTQPPGAWIPDASLWAGFARGPAATRIRPTGITLARTSLVIAMPRSAAALTPAFGTSVSWRFLLPASAGGPASALGLHVEFPDPLASATGLVALTELERLFGPGTAGQAALARFAVHVQTEPAVTGPAPLAALADWAPERGAGAVSPPVTITTEQAVVEFDHAHPSQPLAVRYPAEGSQQLSYPYLVTATSAAAVAAARQFGDVLRSPYATSYVRYMGFRTGTGQAGNWPRWYGLASAGPRLLPPLTTTQAGAARQSWQRLTLGSRDLALIDISSAMAAPASKGGPDLAHLLGQAAMGLGLFPDSTQLGLWTFPSRVVDGLSYQELVPVGPLAGWLGQQTRRQRIGQLVTSERPLTAPAPLYGSILTAYQKMLATYRPHYTNAVLVLTAGVDHSPGDISAATLVHDLQQLYDPRRPVKIVVIMLGSSGDLHALHRIAATTNGQAVAMTSYAQLGPAIYLTAARALCQPAACLSS
jgi:Bacterial extracellular solute-binding protein